MQVKRHNPYKQYVEVRADFLLDGRIIPRWFRPEDGEKVIIDRVTDMRQAASLKAGGQGMRYTCIVNGQEMYLFHDRDEWFAENQSIL